MRQKWGTMNLETTRINGNTIKNLLPEEILDTITKVITSVLTISKKIDICEPLFDYGMNSINAIEISEKLSEKLKIDFSPILLWDHVSIQAIAQYITDSNQ